MNTLAERIKSSRKEAGLNKSQFARLAGVSAPTVTDWESGTIAEIKAANIFKISDELGLNPKWLSTGKGARRLTAGPRSQWMQGFEGGGVAEMPADNQAYKALNHIIHRIAADYENGKLSDDDLKAIGDFADYRKNRKR